MTICKIVQEPLPKLQLHHSSFLISIKLIVVVAVVATGEREAKRAKPNMQCD